MGRRSWPDSSLVPAKLDHVKRLKQLEAENARPRQAADLTPPKPVLKKLYAK